MGLFSRKKGETKDVNSDIKRASATSAETEVEYDLNRKISLPEDFLSSGSADFDVKNKNPKHNESLSESPITEEVYDLNRRISMPKYEDSHSYSSGSTNQTFGPSVNLEQMYPEAMGAYMDAKDEADKALEESSNELLGTIRDAETVLDRTSTPSDYSSSFASRQAQKILDQFKKDDPNFDYSFKHNKGEVRSGPNQGSGSGKHL